MRADSGRRVTTASHNGAVLACLHREGARPDIRYHKAASPQSKVACAVS